MPRRPPATTRSALELRSGRKQGHWIWFILPELRGLGQSATSVYHSLTSRDEAAAYLAHPTLGARLGARTSIVLTSGAPSAEAIFGGLDSMKFRCSMILFAALAGPASLFSVALERFFGGQPDPRTLALLG